MSAVASRIVEAFLSQAWGDYVTWVMMLAAFGLMMIVMSRQHRMLRSYIDEPSPEMQAMLFTMARGRGNMILFLWILLTGSVVAYDIRLAYEEAPAEENAIAPATPSLSADMAAMKPGTATAAQPPLSRDEAIDGIKSFYEDAFVSFYYLTKCGVAEAGDDAKLYQGLTAELGTLNARHEAAKVLDAAKGSFQIIYSESSCDAASLTPVKKDFKLLIDRLPLRLNRLRPA